MTTSSTQTCPDDLIQALTGDGFTVYRADPADQPAAAVIAFYEWDNYIDVLTMPLEGPAAARLAKPVDVLDPTGHRGGGLGRRLGFRYPGAPRLRGTGGP